MADGEHPIGAIRELGQYQEPLEELGFESLEQLMNAAQVAGPELAAYLQTPLDQIGATINAVASHAAQIPAAALNTISKASYSLGVSIDNIPRLSVAPSISRPTSLAPSVSFVNEMPPIRDQEQRGT